MIRQNLKEFRAATDAESDHTQAMQEEYREEEDVSDTSSILRLPHLAVDKDKLAEIDMYGTELKQLIYLLHAQLVHQTRERVLTLGRAPFTIEPIRSELGPISRQLRNFKEIVWHSHHDLRNEKS